MDRPLGERAAGWPHALRKKRRRGGRTPKPGGSTDTRDGRESVLVRILPLRSLRSLPWRMWVEELNATETISQSIGTPEKNPRHG